MNTWHVLASIVSILWTFFKSAGFLEMRRLSKLERLFQALEVGVSEAWTTVVKPYLNENPPGTKLSPLIRERAEKAAIEAATKQDKIVRKFDKEAIRATLKAAVEDAKRRGDK